MSDRELDKVYRHKFSDKAKAFEDLVPHLLKLVDLPFVSKYKLKVDTSKTSSDCGRRYEPLNPSIIVHGDGYLVNVRTVNYLRTDGVFYAFDNDGKGRSRNFLIYIRETCGSFVEVWQTELLNPFSFSPSISLYEGMEDVQLYRDKDDKLNCLCTVWNEKAYGHIGNASIDLTFDESSAEPRASTTSMTVYETGRVEKNWLPFVDEEHAKAVYMYDPLTIVDFEDVESGLGRKNYLHFNMFDYSQWKGSAAPINHEVNGTKGRLLIVHESPIYKNKRVYINRFVFYSDEWTLVSLSLPFIFENLSIEFCRSMTLSIDGLSLLIGVGIEDREAYIYQIQISQVNNLLYSHG